jgi:hypothetical protein
MKERTTWRDVGEPRQGRPQKESKDRLESAHGNNG